jgi:hypothetical protein
VFRSRSSRVDESTMIERGLSQVLFSFLPDQTADLGRNVHRVVRWSDPKYVGVDVDIVRRDVERASYPWTVTGADEGLSDFLRSGIDVQVVSPSERAGVEVEPFPKLYRCGACGRLRESNRHACPCGAQRWTHFQFVAYHECGRLETPWIKSCETHNDRRLEKVARTTQTSDLVFDCPVCKKVLQKGFVHLKCKCRWGGTLKYNVHRAAAVYTQRSTIIVNPPDPSTAAKLKSTAGAALTLRWVLGGMKATGPLDTPPTIDSLIAAFVAQGIDESTARTMAEAAAAQAGGQVATDANTELKLEGEALDEARDAALKLAYATSGGRVRVEDLIGRAGPKARVRYESLYGPAISHAGLDSVELLENFPVLTAAFGFTRGGDGSAGSSSLRWFKGDDSSLRLHGLRSDTEALLFRLDPVRAAQWLCSRGHLATAPEDPVSARLSILETCDVPRAGEDPSLGTSGAELLRLVHSFAHRVIRKISAFSGLERDSLSEYLIPLHLAFVVFANSRGNFVLGGLQALFENDLEKALKDVVDSDHRCALDPGCDHNGAACAVCLHVGEPSCRFYNQFLSRRTLFGPNGYFAGIS